MNASDTRAADLTLFDYLRPLWRFKWIALIVVTITVAAVYSFYDRQTKSYEAASQIYVGPSTGEVSPDSSALQPRDLSNQARLVGSPDVASLVAKDLGYKGDPVALTGAIKVVPDPSADFIGIIATSSSPQATAQLANSFAKSYLTYRLDARRKVVRQSLASARVELAGLPKLRTDTAAAGQRQATLAKISSLKDELQFPARPGKVTVRAFVPTAAISPKPVRNALFGLAISLLLCIIAAYLLDRSDQRLRNASDVEDHYAEQLLARIPVVRQPSPLDAGIPTVPGALEEPFRTLRVNLTLAGVPREHKSLLITSATPGEGKSTIVRNLALAYRDAGLRVVVLEADLRRPSLGATFGATGHKGLAELLLGTARIDEVLQVITDPANPGGSANGHGSYGPPEQDPVMGQIEVITAGSTLVDPTTILTEDRVGPLLSRLTGMRDLVLIDTPPALTVSDVLPLLKIASGTVIVARAGVTTRDAAIRMRRTLDRSDHVHLLGIALIGLDDELAYDYESKRTSPVMASSGAVDAPTV
jgi:succinoglycan biosynthesis transport protein ExoP